MTGVVAQPESQPSRPFPDPEHSIAPRKPRTLGGVVFLSVLAMTLAGLGMVTLDRWRSGLTFIGCALLFGALARLAIPDSSAGMLGLRRKLVDVTTLVLVGGGLILVAASIEGRPR